MTREGLNNARDQTRPYIFAKPGVVGDPSKTPKQLFDEQLERDHKIAFNVTLHNVGSSPAKIIATSLPQVFVGENAFDFAKRCAISYVSESDFMLAPEGPIPSAGAQLQLQTMRTPVLTDEQIAKIRENGAFRAVAFGAIKYTSLRGGDYVTHYCFTYVPIGQPIGNCGVCNDANKQQPCRGKPCLHKNYGFCT